MAYTLPHNSSAAPRARLVKTLLALTVAASAYAANIDTYWTGAAGNGDWLDGANWNNGVPIDRSPGDVQRAFFTSTGNGASSGLVNDVTLGGTSVFNALHIGNSTQKTLNLTLLDGASLTSTGTVVVGGSASAPAHFNLIGPDTGSATFTYGGAAGFQLAGNAGGSGSTATFSGAGLQIIDNGSNTTIGRLGNGHTLTIGGGATFSGKGVVVSGTVDVANGVGNNHKFIVTGEGTNVTLSGLTGTTGTLGLVVGARPLTGQSASSVQSGNNVTVSDGASLRVIGDNPDATVSVIVGTTNYRVNNSITVTGAGSVLEVSGNIATSIGNSSTSTYGNHVTVSDGGTFRTDAVFTINNGATIAANRRNILAIGAGGTFASSSVVNNNGGLITLAEGGALVGQTLAGAAAPLSVNINGTGRFEAAGSGLGDTVTVNVGSVSTSEAVLAVGLAGHASATTFTVNSELNFNDGSLLELTLFSGGIDSIFLGDDASVTIGDNVGLAVIGASGATIAPGDYQVFSGYLAAIEGSFAADRVTLPTLDEGLSWDLSRFNSAGNWTLTVASPIPEPASAVLLLGLGSASIVAFRRRRRA